MGEGRKWKGAGGVGGGRGGLVERWGKGGEGEGEGVGEDVKKLCCFRGNQREGTAETVMEREEHSMGR